MWGTGAANKLHHEFYVIMKDLAYFLILEDFFPLKLYTDADVTCSNVAKRSFEQLTSFISKRCITLHVNPYLNLRKMARSEEIAAHRSVIRFCVDLGLTPVETQKKMQSTERHKNVFRALVYKLHLRYSDGLSADPQEETRGRPKGKDECIVKDVQRIINKDRRQTV